MLNRGGCIWLQSCNGTVRTQWHHIANCSVKLRQACYKPGSFTLVDNYKCMLSQAVTWDTTPAPTVLPPSRRANLRPASMATGAISSNSAVTLSPGITISVPAGRVTVPAMPSNCSIHMMNCCTDYSWQLYCFLAWHVATASAHTTNASKPCPQVPTSVAAQESSNTADLHKSL